jgi:hypothetical protein
MMTHCAGGSGPSKDVIMPIHLRVMSAGLEEMAKSGLGGIVLAQDREWSSRRCKVL